MRQSIGEFLLRRLKEVGIKHVIGVPGDFNLQWLEQFDKVNGIEFVNATNELNAAYAADGYAREQGIGALLTTYGVGELSALNGVAGAAAEHVPVISIVGAPPLRSSENRVPMHHSLADGDYDNMLAAFAPFTHMTVSLHPRTAVADIDRAILGAYFSKRPVHIHLPSDISYFEVEVPRTKLSLKNEVHDEAQLAQALDAITDLFKKAKRPMVLGDMDAERHGFVASIERIIEAWKLPYGNISTGKGILDEHGKLFVGTYMGALSSGNTREAVEESDALMIFTPRFIETNSGGFTSKLPENVVNIDGSSVRVADRVFGGFSGAVLLERLAEIAEANPVKRRAYNGGATGPTKAAKFKAQPKEELTHARLWPRIAEFVSEGDVVYAEAGTSNIGLSPQKLPSNVKYITSNIWGSIGYTLPAYFGSLLANPKRRNLLFIGDGSFQLTAQELSTILRLKQKAIIFLVNNYGYTIERWIMGMKKAYNDVPEWDYQLLPQALLKNSDFPTYRVQTEGELEEVLAKVEKDGRGFIELVLHPEDAPAGLKGFGPAVARFDYDANGPVNDAPDKKWA